MKCVEVQIHDKSGHIARYPVCIKEYYNHQDACSFKIASKHLSDFKSAFNSWGIKECLGSCQIDDAVSEYFYDKEECDYKFVYVHQRELYMVGANCEI